MLYIIGMILKIIGIILAVILGILVLLVCIVFFVPVRYEAAAKFPEDIKSIYAQVKVSWLLHIISGRAVYENGELSWRARIFWKIIENGEDEIDAEENVGKEAETVVKKSENKMQETPILPQNEEQIKVQQKENRETLKKSQKDSAEGALSKKAENEFEKKDSEKKRESFFEKMSEIIKSIFEKIKYTFHQICDKIKVVLNKKEEVVVFLENKTHRAAFARLKKEMIWLKRFLKPKKLKTDLVFGFEDPYNTGQVLAALSMIYPFVGEYMNIRPDFERRVLEGEFYMKGNLRMIHMVILMWKLVWDRNVRTTFFDAKKFLGK